MKLFIICTIVALELSTVSAIWNLFPCPNVLCGPRNKIPRPCLQETVLYYNKIPCRGCPQNICNIVPYCPNVMCAQVEIPEQCRIETFMMTTYGGMCRGCPRNICGNTGCQVPGGCQNNQKMR